MERESKIIWVSELRACINALTQEELYVLTNGSWKKSPSGYIVLRYTDKGTSVEKHLNEAIYVNGKEL